VTAITLKNRKTAVRELYLQAFVRSDKLHIIEKHPSSSVWSDFYIDNYNKTPLHAITNDDCGCCNYLVSHDGDRITRYRGPRAEGFRRCVGSCAIRELDESAGINSHFPERRSYALSRALTSHRQRESAIINAVATAADADYYMEKSRSALAESRLIC